MTSVRCCKLCGNTYPLTEDFFHKKGSPHSGFRNICKTCRNEKQVASRARSGSLYTTKGYLWFTEINLETNKVKCIRCEKYQAKHYFYMNYQTNTLYRSCKLCLKNRSYKNDGKALRPNAGIEESGYKKCSRCGEVKAETEFHRKGKYRQPFCITCRLAYLKEHRAKPHVKEYRKLERQVSKASKRASFLGRKNYVKIPDIVKLFHRQDEKCFYCGEKMLKTDFTIDHVIPFSKGGHNTIGNILLCCRSCNAKKARKLLIEWLPPSERIW